MTNNATKRPRGRPKTFDRTRTLDVAMESYWREGIDAVSLNEICRRSDISKPGLYREFGDEDHLMDAVLNHYAQQVLGGLLTALSEDRPFQETLERLIDFATREESPEIPAGCLLVKMRNLRWRLGPATAKRVDDLRAGAIAGYTAWLEQRAAKGEVKLTAPVGTLATYTDAQLTMMLTQMSAGEDPERIRAHARLAFAVLNPSPGSD